MRVFCLQASRYADRRSGGQNDLPNFILPERFAVGDFSNRIGKSDVKCKRGRARLRRFNARNSSQRVTLGCRFLRSQLPGKRAQHLLIGENRLVIRACNPAMYLGKFGI